MVTFVVTGDIQIGNPTQVPNKRGFVELCNRIKPDFVIHAGDVTDLGENGDFINYAWYVIANNCWYPCICKPSNRGWPTYPPQQLTEYIETYVDRIAAPVLECRGNHDTYSYPSQPVKKYIETKHGGLWYKKKYGDLAVYSLDVYPTREISDWLAAQLLADESPYVCFWHYPIVGPFEEEWPAEDKAYFYSVVTSRKARCLAIYVGHTHGSAHYVYNGIPQYDGSGAESWVVTFDGATLNHTKVPNST